MAAVLCRTPAAKMSTESQTFTHRVTAQADWFIRQPSSGVTQELREFIHNSRAVGLSLNAQRVWATLEDNVSVEVGLHHS